MILFSERKRLAELYKNWLKENPAIADVPLNVVTFLCKLLDERKVRDFLEEKEEV